MSHCTLFGACAFARRARRRPLLPALCEVVCCTNCSRMHRVTITSDPSVESDLKSRGNLKGVQSDLATSATPAQWARQHLTPLHGSTGYNKCRNPLPLLISSFPFRCSHVCEPVESCLATPAPLLSTRSEPLQHQWRGEPARRARLSAGAGSSGWRCWHDSTLPRVAWRKLLPVPPDSPSSMRLAAWPPALQPPALIAAAAPTAAATAVPPRVPG